MQTSDNEIVVVAAFLASAKSEGVEAAPKYVFALDANSEIRRLNADQCEGKSNVFEINFGTWCSSAKRENFNCFHIFMFQLRHKNITHIAHSCHKEITRKVTLECKRDYDEN